MSTGQDCRFYEKTPRQWFYDLEDRYHRERYDTYGPFPTFRAAKDDLRKNHSNPGGYTTSALPGCPHDLTRPRLHPLAHEPWTHECDRCGEFIDRRSDAEKAAFKKASLWARDSIQFPRLLAEINAVGLTKKQRADLCTSMDVTDAEITELLNRAEREWEKQKDRAQ